MIYIFRLMGYTSQRTIFKFFKKDEKPKVEPTEHLELEKKPKKQEAKKSEPEEPQILDVNKKKMDFAVPMVEVKDDNIYADLDIKKTAKERNRELKSMVNPELLKLDNVTLKKYNKNNFKRGLEPGEQPFPVNARIGPYEVKNPIYGAKNYYWCACGMSKSQPFCDESHIGTKFKPLKFRLEQPADSIQLCG